jgi:hypothetical protein
MQHYSALDRKATGCHTLLLTCCCQRTALVMMQELLAASLNGKWSVGSTRTGAEVTSSLSFMKV